MGSDAKHYTEERASLLNITGNSRKWRQEASFWYCWPWWHPRLQHFFLIPVTAEGTVHTAISRLLHPTVVAGTDTARQLPPMAAGVDFPNTAAVSSVKMKTSMPRLQLAKKMSARNLDVYGGR